MLNVLFACAALSALLFYLVQREFVSPHHTAAPPSPVAGMTAPQANNNQANNDNDEIYTGSIVVVQRGGGDQCWWLNFDNRTGAMSAGRYADCNLVTETNENQTRTVPDSVRMQAISAAFTRK